jgi:hypothetical protein
MSVSIPKAILRIIIIPLGVVSPRIPLHTHTPHRGHTESTGSAGSTHHTPQNPLSCSKARENLRILDLFPFDDVQEASSEPILQLGQSHSLKKPVLVLSWISLPRNKSVALLWTVEWLLQGTSPRLLQATSGLLHFQVVLQNRRKSSHSDMLSSTTLGRCLSEMGTVLLKIETVRGKCTVGTTTELLYSHIYS